MTRANTSDSSVAEIQTDNAGADVSVHTPPPTVARTRRPVATAPPEPPPPVKLDATSMQECTTKREKKSWNRTLESLRVAVVRMLNPLPCAVGSLCAS